MRSGLVFLYGLVQFYVRNLLHCRVLLRDSHAGKKSDAAAAAGPESPVLQERGTGCLHCWGGQNPHGKLQVEDFPPIFGRFLYVLFKPEACAGFWMDSCTPQMNQAS